MGLVERVWAEFASHEDARRSDLAYYRRLSPQQRLDILLELITTFRSEEDAFSERLERVCRVAKLPAHPQALDSPRRCTYAGDL